jgi:SAM-dependent methyltransferase
MTFKDHFSTQAADYAKYRPHYPEKLFDYLASISPNRKVAWDCGTGNGQAARGLAPYFDLVIATDPSEKQIRNAVPHEKIKYVVAPAEQTDILPQTVDLITVAQALHWFDFDRFYAEVSRVAQPRGIIAVWLYNLLDTEPAITQIVNEYYFDIVGPYWPPERKHIENAYRAIPFPFAEIKAPPFSLEAFWNLEALLGYLNTWSATQKYIARHGDNPLEKILARLASAWGDPENPKRLEWPLLLRVGRVA